MKTKLLLTSILVSAVACVVADYFKFKSDLLIRHASGESDWERRNRKH